MSTRIQPLKSLFFILLLLALAGALAIAWQDNSATAADSGTRYEVEASRARLVRRVGSPVTNSVNGVPAEPVHAFAWNGDGVTPIEGWARLEIDAVANSGEITAEWTDPAGREWTFHQEAFGPAPQIPPHPTGLRLGPSASTTDLVPEDPVPTDVYLHGDTTAGEPVLPTLFNHLATWGPATVTVDGALFNNPFDGPTPRWVAHTMTTVGARDEDGKVWARDDDGNLVIYNPMKYADKGIVDWDDTEFHLTFHDAPGPEMTANFPPPLSFFYHVQFEDVKMEVEHID